MPTGLCGGLLQGLLSLHSGSPACSSSFHRIARFLDQKQIMNHPQMSSIISNQDEDLLGYMLSLEVSWNCVWAEHKGSFRKSKRGQALRFTIMCVLSEDI